MELNTTMSVLRQFSLKQWHRIYTIQKHKICLLVKTTCYGATQTKLTRGTARDLRILDSKLEITPYIREIQGSMLKISSLIHV